MFTKTVDKVFLKESCSRILNNAVDRCGLGLYMDEIGDCTVTESMHFRKLRTVVQGCSWGKNVFISYIQCKLDCITVKVLKHRNITLNSFNRD